jgi:indolepyruvate ferredoxin oxidoreductase beta subunit
MKGKEKLKISIIGVGGLGVLTTSRLLGEAAVGVGMKVFVSEVHGMAQRGGVVETHVCFNAHSPLVGEGEADIILGLEPAETLRVMNKASKKTWVIANTRPIIPVSVSLKLSEYPNIEESFAKIESFVERLIALDATELAKKAGSAIATNMVMLGALAATEKLPYGTDVLRQTIKERTPRYADINLKAFELGYQAVSA